VSLERTPEHLVRGLQQPMIMQPYSSNTIVVFCSALVCVASVASSTRASCTQPALALVWSSPAAGERNVPLDAAMQLLTTTPRTGSWSAVLNDREIGTGNADNIELGVLEPDTDYTFRLLPVGNGARSPSSPIEIEFRTGSSTSSAVDAPVVASTQVLPQPPQSSPECSAALLYDNCFDTPPLVFRTFDLSESSAVAYELRLNGGRATLWPAGCEVTAPEQPEHARAVSRQCYEISAIDARGTRSAVTEHCIDNDMPGRAPAPPPSCSLHSVAASQSPSWLSVALAALFVLARNRARSLRTSTNRQGSGKSRH
jgi:hypothetical protein